MRTAFSTLSMLVAALLFSASAGAEPFLRIVQPYENNSLPNVKSSFVFGSVLPATATLTINGQLVKPYVNGGFLAMVPLEPGRFKIEAIADDGVSSTTVIRYINVAGEPVPYPDDDKEIHPALPTGRRVVRVGDVIDVSFKAAPGGEAHYKFDDTSALLPMEETKPGTYKSVYTIRAADKFDGVNVAYTLKRKDGKKITGKANADIIVQRRETPRVVELKEEAVLLTGPDNDFGYNLFSLPGVRFEVTGEANDFMRLAVGTTGGEGWVRKSSVVEMAAGTPLSRSVSRNIRVWTNGSSSFVELPLQARHLHRIEQTLDPHVLRVTLYGVTADTDRIRYATENTVVRDINWFQPTPDAFTFEVRTRQALGWGYDVRYENNTFVLEIRHKPQILAGKPPSPKLPSLKGIRVAVDAGHSVQSFGTIGPWANTEAAVNLATAKVIKTELEKRGAEVVMIQDGTREMSLPDRVVAAWKSRAQFFISLHCDAVAEGMDPRETEGYSVHYFHPQSQPLAETLHKAYGAATGIADAGLWRSNLAVCRTPTMPALLLEMGFLILPEQEEKLLSIKNQKATADAIATSLRDLLTRGDK